MAKSLIIVESPAKTKTLKAFLGPSYDVEASMGHVRDLPEKQLGVDVDDGFKPKYVAIPSRKDVIKRLSDAAAKVDTVFLATDPDREGEAIAWHLANALKLKAPQRIQFNEITRQAVEHAITDPRTIDELRVSAQEARRILDRLVGYRISPLLWKKVQKNLSAGRVQSVAVRLVCDREREILAFVPEEYWSVTASLEPSSVETPAPTPVFSFEAKLVSKGAEKLALGSEGATQAVLDELGGAEYRVSAVRQQERKRSPAPPFITSTLQQEASRKLGFTSRRTMSVAQSLYEGVALGEEGAVGLITYMRTDSTRVASEAQQEARRLIEERYGANYLPAKSPRYKARAAAQDAHEAIRPTSVFRAPDTVSQYLKPEQMKLYRLIWQRFIASQMLAAIFDVTSADIAANVFIFRATGSTLRFDGFMKVYQEGRDTEETPDEDREPLPKLEVGRLLNLLSLTPRQHFTEPPPRYTEATIVKALEEKGIGRPSTYASIISTIQDREYVVLEDRRFRPTELGMTVNDLLVKHFPTIMDVGFTAEMERKLDAIEEGEGDKVQVLTDFYVPFQQMVSEAHEKMERLKPQQVETEHLCPNCGKVMMLRQSKRGPFLGCSGYPRCKTILNVDGTPVAPSDRPQPVVTDQKCPKCGKPLVEREGPYGKFLGCSGYPRCRTIVRVPGSEGAGKGPAAAEPTDIVCPKCGGQVVTRKTRYGSLYLCSNEGQCDFKTWHRPVNRPCPECSWPLVEQCYRGKPTGKIKCSNPDCDHKEAGTAPKTTPGNEAS